MIAALFALACASPDTQVVESDLDAVTWSGEFSWNEDENLDFVDPGGTVDFTVEQAATGEWTGTLDFVGPTAQGSYLVEGTLEDGTFTLTETSLVAEEHDDVDLEWCLGDYVFAFEPGGDVLSGSYFPTNEACARYTGSAALVAD